MGTSIPAPTRARKRYCCSRVRAGFVHLATSDQDAGPQLIGLVEKLPGVVSGRLMDDGPCGDRLMVYTPYPRFCCCCGVRVSWLWKLPGGWLLNTSWIRDPAGIWVKLGSTEMSSRTVWFGVSNCWLALVY